MIITVPLKILISDMNIRYRKLQVPNNSVNEGPQPWFILDRPKKTGETWLRLSQVRLHNIMNGLLGQFNYIYPESWPINTWE